MYYKFKLGHNAADTTKNICFAKGDGTVDHNTVNRWSLIFRSDCKTLDNQVMSGRPKTGDSKP